MKTKSPHRANGEGFGDHSAAKITVASITSPDPFQIPPIIATHWWRGDSNGIVLQERIAA
jgi:hypothetical protein